MGAINQSFARADRVDFRAVSFAALGALDIIVPRLLPDGYSEGNEWVARNPTRNDGRPGSFKVNLTTGVWSDFATGDKGGDIIDLVAYLERKSKVEAAREIGAMLNVKPASGSDSLTGNVRDARPKKSTSTAAAPEEASTQPPAFPVRTPPDKDGKPRFISAGDEGPRVRDGEKRRHVYRQGGVPVRIKVITNDNAFNVFRVTNYDGETGWQYRKPEGFRSVPYFSGNDPFASSSALLFWPEGEKDVESVVKRGGAAFTFGGTGDGLPPGCEQYLVGRMVVILADNDAEGRRHAEEKASLAATVAENVRVIHFPELANKQDVSDWFALGNSFEELIKRVEAVNMWESAASSGPDLNAEEQQVFERADRKKSLPLGYSFSDRGLMYQNPDDLDKPALLIAGHCDVLAETRDTDGASWGVLLHWKDHDGRDHQFALPRSTLAGDGSEARRILMDGGFYIAPSQTARGLFNSFLLAGSVAEPGSRNAAGRLAQQLVCHARRLFRRGQAGHAFAAKRDRP